MRCGTCGAAVHLTITEAGRRLPVDARPDQHQLGALDIVVRRNAFGRQVQSFETDLSLTGVGGGPVRAVFIRAPLVVDAGESVETLATLDDGRVVAVRQGALLGTAFHPEVTGEHRFHELFLDTVRAG